MPLNSQKGGGVSKMNSIAYDIYLMIDGSIGNIPEEDIPEEDVIAEEEPPKLGNLFSFAV